MKPLDDKDYAILKVLRTEARLSTQKISKKTKIPITTVHHHIKRMEKEKIITGYSAILNSERMGSISAYVLIGVMYHLPSGEVINQEELAKKIAKNEIVEDISILTGSKDLIVKLRCKSIQELNHFVIEYLRTIPGIEKTESAVVLKAVQT